jgi:hypothetical protein
LGIGDWGLGIGDLAQSPIPNPQIKLKGFYLFFNTKKIESYELNKIRLKKIKEN